MTSEATTTQTPGGLELPRPPGVVRRFLAAHPLAVDIFVAAFYLIPSVVGALVVSAVHPTPQELIHLVLSAVAGAALLARRQQPAVVFAIATVLLGTSVFLGRDMDVVPTLFALYALAVYRSIRSAWVAFAVTSAVTVSTLVVQVILTQAKVFTPLETAAIPSGILVLSFSVVSVLIGSNVGNRRRYLNALIDRARQLARERDQQAEIAAAAERSRIAREMHDIVSHSLTVMITLADGSARMVDAASGRPESERTEQAERSAQAMRLVAETGRGALADMRRLLGVLRDGEDGTAAREPQPGVGELAELVETFRAAGLPVRITVTGVPPEDIGQQLTIFRVVQEGLTNALRYAPTATAVRVVIVFQPGTVIVTIDDDAALHPSPGQGSGRGLIGLRERVGLYGGTLEAGPRPGGGWRVRAVFDAVRTAAPAATTTADSAPPPPPPPPGDVPAVTAAPAPKNPKENP
ncbi:histidine kinase [Leifsonia sp. 1010]|uniref:sensor histidine kinase n=1 Tax=Leifsonia sp. 1010 TaxID=2817769 RepID=UPI00285D9426|nr:histidine kinase [Leifsonia sp. 1010]MDR6613071.1 signal transduction histidine kinase [Leifsonia sp. 1010]